jgi:hypothetical protein
MDEASWGTRILKLNCRFILPTIKFDVQALSREYMTTTYESLDCIHSVILKRCCENDGADADDRFTVQINRQLDTGNYVVTGLVGRSVHGTVDVVTRNLYATAQLQDAVAVALKAEQIAQNMGWIIHQCHPFGLTNCLASVAREFNILRVFPDMRSVTPRPPQGHAQRNFYDWQKRAADKGLHLV